MARLASRLTFYSTILVIKMMTSVEKCATEFISTADILTRLRQLMGKKNLGAYIVPSVDNHNSEYIADSDRRLRFVSNFSGSRGLAAVTIDKAALWTDGRYFLQCEKQLDPKLWTLMKEGQPEVPTISEWLNNVLPKESLVGIDTKLTTSAFHEELRRGLLKGRHRIFAPAENLIDQIWLDRPAAPKNPVDIMPVSVAGKSCRQKIKDVREAMKKNKCGLLILSALDDIAWLFNLRGSDVPFNPVFFAYCIVSLDTVYLFIDPSKVSDLLTHHLSGIDSQENSTGAGDSTDKEKSQAVKILPYDDFYKHLKVTVENFLNKRTAQNAGSHSEDEYPLVWTPGNSCNYAIVSIVEDESNRLDKLSPVVSLKAIKNPVELAGMKNAQVKDGVAHCQFLIWLENLVKNSTKDKVTEIEAAVKFESFRALQSDYVGLSFDTISGSGPNSAIIHYKPTPESNARLSVDQLYLVDSGSQYKDGTTDITRTVCFQKPTDYQKECFTRVLKGHIALAGLIFPQGTNGVLLDNLARVALWEVGLDYFHGTGHGIGHYLCVHEGPAGFLTRASSYTEEFKENMVITVEPGYYEDGKFGIRIENDYVVVPAETKYKFQNRKMLTFKPITVVPIQLELVDKTLLTEREKNWLDNYHQQCLDVLSPVLESRNMHEELEWLRNACRKLSA